MKILITGGAGFIGYHLAKKLLDKHSLVIVDNLSNGKERNILDLNGDFVFHCCDVNSPDFDNILKNIHVNVIIHLGANSDIKNPDPRVDILDTMQSTISVLECCRNHGIKQFIFASSSAIYGIHKEPIKEDTGGLYPISHYGAAKLASEAFISSYSYQYGIQSWICRFPNVTGPRATHGIIHDLKKKLENGLPLEIIGDGSQEKPYIYVDDLVSAILFIWHNAKERFNVFNIGVKDTISVKEIAKMVAPELVFTGKSWRGDVPHYKYDSSKLKKLGWENIRSSREAIKLSIL
jgi:UDP-glucose 4-epimerase